MTLRKGLIILLGAFASLAIALIPWSSQLPAQMALAIIFFAVVLWVSEAIPLYVTGILILFLEVVFLYPEIKKIDPSFKSAAFFQPYFSNIIALFLGGMLLAEGISRYKLDTMLTRRVVMLAGGKPSLVLLALMLTMGFLSMWISNTAATALGMILVLSLVKNLPEGSSFHKAFFLGVPFAANMGGIGTPVGTPPNAIALAFLRKAGADTISFGEWLLALAPFALSMVVLTWLLLIFIYKPPKARLNLEKGGGISFTPARLIVVLTFFTTAIMWLTSGFHKIPDGITALIPVIILLGGGLLTVRDFKSISWDVLFLVGGGMALSVALQKSGLSEMIAMTIPTENLSLPVTMIAFALIGLFLSNIMSNTATANILIPLVFLIPNIEYLPVVLALAISVSSAMALPISTPPNALAYSSGKIDVRSMMKVGSLVGIMSVVIFFFAGVPWLKLLGYMK